MMKLRPHMIDSKQRFISLKSEQAENKDTVILFI